MYIQLIHIERLHQDTGEKEKDFQSKPEQHFHASSLPRSTPRMGH